MATDTFLIANTNGKLVPIDDELRVVAEIRDIRAARMSFRAIAGADGGPVQTEELSTLEIARRVAFLLASAGKENS